MKIRSALAIGSSIRAIDGWLSAHEGTLLYHLARLTPAVGEVVEIGSWKGKSTICLAFGLADGGKAGSVWAVDPHQGNVAIGKKIQGSTYKEFLTNITRARVKRFVKPLRMTSKRASHIWKGKQIRLLFIDGLHDFAHTKEDFLLWHQNVTEGGIIAFHDCFCGISGVTRAADEVFLSPERIRSVGTVGSILYGEKGKATGLDRPLVVAKIALIRASNRINRWSIMPPWMKRILIHTCIRPLLATQYTLAVYTQYETENSSSPR